MCGRFYLRIAGRELADSFDLPDALLFERYNIAPGHTVPVVVQVEAGRQLRMMKWGLAPSWAKDASSGFKTINARSETVADEADVPRRLQETPLPCSGVRLLRVEDDRQEETADSCSDCGRDCSRSPVCGRRGKVTAARRPRSRF